jgi:uncharacterized protein YjbI with pentapeptide repeats
VPEPVRRPYPPDAEPGTAPLLAFGDLTDAEVEDVDWANRSGRGISMRRLVVRRSRLTGAELGESELADVRFLDCRLDLVGLRHATLQRVRFEDCRLTECDLSGARLVDVAFERCELRGASLRSVSLERVSFERCDLLGLRGADGLRGASMTWEDVLANAPTLAAAVGIELLD